jgi:hypothetical protein
MNPFLVEERSGQPVSLPGAEHMGLRHLDGVLDLVAQLHEQAPWSA